RAGAPSRLLAGLDSEGLPAGAAEGGVERVRRAAVRAGLGGGGGRGGRRRRLRRLEGLAAVVAELGPGGVLGPAVRADHRATPAETSSRHSRPIIHPSPPTAQIQITPRPMIPRSFGALARSPVIVLPVAELLEAASHQGR